MITANELLVSPASPWDDRGDTQPMGLPKVPAADDRFPHKCPKCGRAAYIGLNKVEHRDGPCPK